MKDKSKGYSTMLWRAASLSLAVCCLLPIVVIFYLMGIWLDSHFPELTLVQVLIALPFIGLSIALLMFAGASVWLLFARFWVPHQIAETFFVIDGLGWFSTISHWLYKRAYS
jgi:hypothetical protein